MDVACFSFSAGLLFLSTFLLSILSYTVLKLGRFFSETQCITHRDNDISLSV